MTVPVDGRADVYGDAMMDESSRTYYIRGKNWPDGLQRWGIQTVVLPPDAPLVTALRAMPDWKPVYGDAQAVVLTKIR